MWRYKNQIVAFVILAYSAYFFYQYANGWIFYKDQNQSGETITRIRNPLSVVFLGHESRSEDGTTYISYDVTGRLNYATSTCMIVLLSLGLIRFFRKKSNHNTLLTIYFLFDLWRKIAAFIFMFFYYAWNHYHPGTDVLSYHREFFTVAQGITLLLIAADIFILYNVLERRNVTMLTSSRSLRGIRGFHFVFDRVLILLFGNNFFLFTYVFHRGEGGWRDLMWISVSIEVALIVCYIICERFFGCSPSKLLTGMLVVEQRDSATIAAVSTATAVKRSLFRVVPFEAFSFLSSNGGWHDLWSRSTVLYVGSDNPLKRMTKIVEVVFWILLVAATWYLVTWTEQAELIRCRNCQEMGQLPLHISVIIFPLAVMLFSGWLAALADYSSTQDDAAKKSSYLKMLAWWVPIHNMTMLKSSTDLIIENLSPTLNQEVVDKLLRAATILRRCFGVFFFFLFCGLLALWVVNDWAVALAMLCCLSCGVIIWSIGTLIFVSRIKKHFI